MKEKNTSDRLKQIMNERNLKQVDILNKVQPYCREFNQKINKSHLSQWVSGTNEPNQSKLYILALALGVSEPWLMGYDVPMERKEIFTKENAILDAKITNDPVLKEAIKKYYELNEYDRKLILDFIDYKYDRREC